MTTRFTSSFKTDKAVLDKKKTIVIILLIIADDNDLTNSKEITKYNSNHDDTV